MIQYGILTRTPIIGRCNYILSCTKVLDAAHVAIPTCLAVQSHVAIPTCLGCVVPCCHTYMSGCVVSCCHTYMSGCVVSPYLHVWLCSLTIPTCLAVQSGYSSYSTHIYASSLAHSQLWVQQLVYQCVTQTASQPPMAPAMDALCINTGIAPAYQR